MAAAFLLLSAEPAANAATVLTLSPVPGLLEKTVCQSNLCAPVAYTVMPELNVANLDYAIHAASAPIAVVAYSQGSLAAEQWLRQHASDPDAPTTDQLAFVLIGNPSRAYGGNPLLGAGVPPSQYQVIDIVREYDIVADAPLDPTNTLAMANALAGFFFVHLDTGFDINDPANVVWKVGNTTYVMVPTKNLPLLEPLRALGLSELADALNGPLKAIVDQAYDRSVPVAALAVQPAPIPVGTSAASTSIVSKAALTPEIAAAPVDLDPAADTGPAAGASDTLRLVDTSSSSIPPDAGDEPGTEAGETTPTGSANASGSDQVGGAAVTTGGVRTGGAKSAGDPVTSTGHRTAGSLGNKSAGSDAAAAGGVGSKPGASTAGSASGSAGSESRSASSGAGSTGSGGSGTGGEGA